MSLRGETNPVSERHRFDEKALALWLPEHLPEFEGPVEICQFKGGQSNPTFLLEAGSGDYVLRKKPPGSLLPSAHAIDREYRVLQALADSDVPVPKARSYCDDDTIIGTPFYVMDHQPGRIFTNPLLPTLDNTERAALYESMNETLARLHSFDWETHGLGDFGKPGNYFARQVSRWCGQFEKLKTEDVPSMDALSSWLRSNIPDDETTTVVHGDYRLANLIIHPTEPRVVAVLDWELSTLGHPLSDLAYNCMTYSLPAAHPLAPGFVGADIDDLGIPTEDDYLSSYAEHAGLDPKPLWRFCVVFSLYRVAAIQLGVYSRAMQGNASSDTAHLFGESYRMVADAGWDLASGG